MSKHHLSTLRPLKTYLSFFCLSSFFYVLVHVAHAQETSSIPTELNPFFATQNLSTQSLILKFPENWYSLHNQLVSSSTQSLSLEVNQNSLPQKITDLGAPVMWSDKLALSRDNYDKYLELWNKRILQKTGDYQVLLEPTELAQDQEQDSNEWLLRLIGDGRYSRLIWIYQPETQSWQSPNMRLNYLGEVQTHEQSAFGQWSGKIWQNSRQNSQGTWIETLAFGKDADNKTLIIYRTQAIKPNQEIWFDESLVLRSE